MRRNALTVVIVLVVVLTMVWARGMVQYLAHREVERLRDELSQCRAQRALALYMAQRTRGGYARSLELSEELVVQRADCQQRCYRFLTDCAAATGWEAPRATP